MISCNNLSPSSVLAVSVFLVFDLLFFGGSNSDFVARLIQKNKRCLARTGSGSVEDMWAWNDVESTEGCGTPIMSFILSVKRVRLESTTLALHATH